MGFWPYLRQAHMSEERPSAGTWQTFLRRFFLKWENQEIINQRTYFTNMGIFQISVFLLTEIESEANLPSFGPRVGHRPGLRLLRLLLLLLLSLCLCFGCSERGKGREG